MGLPSLLLPNVSQGSNLSFLAWEEVPLSSEPNHWLFHLGSETSFLIEPEVHQFS